MLITLIRKILIFLGIIKYPGYRDDLNVLRSIPRETGYESVHMKMVRKIEHREREFIKKNS